jgi:hypothetical protein
LNQGLFSGIARLRNLRSTPAARIALLEGVARARGDQGDADQLHAVLAAVQAYGEGVESAISGCPIAAQSRLRDLAGVIFAETVLALLVGTIGKAALEAAIEKVRDQAAAERAVVDARAAAEAETARRAQETRLAAAAMAKSPSALLNDLFSRGVQLSVDDAGTINISPPGSLDQVARKVMELRRSEIVSLLRDRQRVEVV